MPHGQGVTLALSKLKRILAIDPVARTARVQPGVRNLAISEAAAVHGLYYAPDPSSQIACSIGGNVAENSGGVHCLKYGLTGAQRAQAARGDHRRRDAGDRLRGAGRAGLRPAGAASPARKGCSAVVTEVTVKLLPKPVKAQVVLAAFDSVVKAGDAVAKIIAAGCIPAGLEMMDKLAIAAVEQFVHAGYPLDAEAILLCECDGTEEEVAAEIERVSRGDARQRRYRDPSVARRRRAAEVLVGAQSGVPRRRPHPARLLLHGRHHPEEETGRSAGRDRRAVEAVRTRPVPNVFHAGDGNLHPLIMFDANEGDQVQRAEAFGSRILELCIEAGGTITGEHGVGIEKINQMCVQFGPGELSAFLAVKHALDPHALLNPGKAVPTLHRCAEFGSMHVHRGQEKFPELPRF